MSLFYLSLILSSFIQLSRQNVEIGADIWNLNLPDGGTWTIFNQKCSYKCSQKNYWDTVTLDLPFPAEEQCPETIEDDDYLKDRFEMDVCATVS